MRDFEIVAKIDDGKKIVKDNSGCLFYLKKMDIYNRSVFDWLLKHSSPYIPEIVEVEEKDHSLYVLERYIEGITLKELLLHDVSNREKMDILTQIMDGLSFLHQAIPPIIHRDLKEENIMIDQNHHVKIIDYDAAKRYQKNEPRDTVLLGTQGSAAPEQYGFGASDMRTDIYALGILMRNMFPNDLNMIEIADKCTQLKPDDRYQTIHELKQAIQSINTVPQTKAAIFPTFNVPGFRSGNVVHMVLAVLGYAFIIYFFVTGDVEYNGEPITDPFLQYINKLAIMIWMVFTIDIFTSWTHFFDRLPGMHSNHPLIRFLSKVVFSFVVILIAAMVVGIIEAIYPLF